MMCKGEKLRISNEKKSYLGKENDQQIGQSYSKEGDGQTGKRIVLVAFGLQDQSCCF